MRTSIKKRGVMAVAVIASLAMALPAAASPIPAHQTPQRNNSPLDDPGDRSCTVDHWHDVGYCEVEHPDPRLMGGLVWARAVPTEDGWVAHARMVWIDLHTGDVIRKASISREFPLDYTPHVHTDPVHAVESAVADGWPLPTAIQRSGGSAPPSAPPGEPARVGCLVRGVASTASLSCYMLD